MSESVNGSPFDEEPWEHEIAALLGSLPPVDPPPGFLDAAIDHRPLYAARTALGALVACGVLAVGVVGLGVFGPDRVTPSVEQLVTRHAEIEAATRGTTRLPIEALVETPAEADTEVLPDGFELPEGFEHTLGAGATDLGGHDLRQAIYRHGDETVSIFTLPGRVDFDDLGGEKVRWFDNDVRAWIDEEAEVLVVEAQDSVLVVVGLPPAKMTLIIDEARPNRSHRLRDAVAEITAQLGFG